MGDDITPEFGVAGNPEAAANMVVDLLKGIPTHGLKALRDGVRNRRGAGWSEEESKSLSGFILKHSGRLGLRGGVLMGEEYDKFHFEDRDGVRVRKDAATTGLTTGSQLAATGVLSPAFNFFPVIAPWRKMIPQTVQGGVATNWEEVNGIDTAFDFGVVAEPSFPVATLDAGRTTPPIAFKTTQRSANFVTQGTESAITLQARFGGAVAINGIDFRPEELARIALTAAHDMRMDAGMIGMITTALNPSDLGTAVEQSTRPAAGTGTLTASTNYKFKFAPLSYLGTRTSAKGRVGSTNSKGEGLPTSSVTIATQASGAGSDALAIKLPSWPKGVWAVNVYCDNGLGGSFFYHSTVYTSLFTIKAAATLTTNTPNTSDTSATSGGYVGFVPQIESYLTSGLNYIDNAGAVLSGDSRGGVKQISDLFLYLAETYHTGPTEITCGYDMAAQILSIVGGSSAPVYRIDLQMGSEKVVGGLVIAGLLNPYMPEGSPNRKVDIVIHPFWARGTIVASCRNLGPNYLFAGDLRVPMEIRQGFGPFAFEQAEMGLYRAMGMYEFGVPVLNVTFGHGVIRNIGRQ